MRSEDTAGLSADTVGIRDTVRQRFIWGSGQCGLWNVECGYLGQSGYSVAMLLLCGSANIYLFIHLFLPPTDSWFHLCIRVVAPR